MSPLPGGCSDQPELQRQVLVVEEDAGRRAHLCALLTGHGLRVRSVYSAELAMELQERSGLVLIGTHRTNRAMGALMERIRTTDERVPVILIGEPTANESPTLPIRACLPRDVSEERLLQEVDRWLQVASPNFPTRRGSILIVDDDPKLRQILRDFLQLKGFVAQAVGSGEDALEELRRMVPAVVLLDIKMPGLGGLNTMKAIRLSHPNLPVIFITQVDEEQMREEAVTLGASEYLVKPFDFDHLETILLTQVFT